MTTHSDNQNAFGPGNPLPAWAASQEARRGSSPRSGSPRDLARRACDWCIDTLGLLFCILCSWWGIDPDTAEDDVDWDT
jgi:hypothetical protein